MTFISFKPLEKGYFDPHYQIFSKVLSKYQIDYLRNRNILTVYKDRHFQNKHSTVWVITFNRFSPKGEFFLRPGPYHLVNGCWVSLEEFLDSELVPEELRKVILFNLDLFS